MDGTLKITLNHDMASSNEKIIVLVSVLFPERQATRFRTPDYTLLGFHPTAAQAFLDFVDDQTLVFDLDSRPDARRWVRDIVSGTLAAQELLDALN